MNKKILAVLCVVVISAVMLALNVNRPTHGQTPMSNQPRHDAALSTRQTPLSASAPEHVIYRQFFHHLMALKERAGEVERQGKTGKKLRSHCKDKIGLKDDQARILDEIAADCDREVAQMDERAKRVIDDARARYPNSVIPAGQDVPTAPPELKRMQRQRDMTILRARYRLRTALGEHGFKQIDDYLKLNFAPNVKPAQLVPQQSGSMQQAQPDNGN